MEQEPRLNIFGIPQPLWKDHTLYFDLIKKSVDGIHKRFAAPNFIDEQIADQIIYMSFLLTPTVEWKESFIEARRLATYFYTDSQTYWKNIAAQLKNPKIEKWILELLPNLDREEYFYDDFITPEIETIDFPPPQRAQPANLENRTLAPKHISKILREVSVQSIRRPEPNPDLKNLSTYGMVKHYAEVRKTTVFNYISEQSGSSTFANIHTFIQHKNNYKLSSRGKVVYDGGFHWIKRELNTSIPTVWRAFHWMSQRKLVTKIAPSNFRNKKRSRWYVCTSMAQNLKLWSSAFRSEGR